MLNLVMLVPYSVWASRKRVGPGLLRFVVDRFGDLLAEGVSGCPGPELKQNALVPDVGIEFGGPGFVGLVGALFAPNEGTQDPHPKDVPSTGQR